MIEPVRIVAPLSALPPFTVIGRLPRVIRIAVMGGGSGASGAVRGFAMAKLSPKHTWVIATIRKRAAPMVNLRSLVFIFSAPSNMMLQKPARHSKSRKDCTRQNLWVSVIDTQNGKPQFFCGDSGRGERIRTSDLSVPNRALYQAEPRPELKQAWILCDDQNAVK